MSRPKLDRLDRFAALTNGWTRHWLAKLTGNELRVYLALAEHFSPGNSGMVWPSHKTLATITGIKRRQSMSEATRGLERAGLVAVIDWPMFTDVGARDYRTLGGGSGQGRPNVYVLTHVDEQGMHRAEQQRIGPADVHKELMAQRETIGRAVRAYRQGLAMSAIQKIMLDAYPLLSEFNPCWTTDTPDDAPAPIEWNDIIMAAVCVSSETLRRRFPVDEKPLIAEFGMQHPDGPSLEDEGRRCSGGYDPEAIREATRPHAGEIVAECHGLEKKYSPDDRLGLDNLGLWSGVAPTVARLCGELEIGPLEIASSALQHVEDDAEGCTLTGQGVHDKRTPPPTENVHPVHDKRTGGARPSVHHRSRPIEGHPSKETKRTQSTDACASGGVLVPDPNGAKP